MKNKKLKTALTALTTFAAATRQTAQAHCDGEVASNYRAGIAIDPVKGDRG